MNTSQPHIHQFLETDATSTTARPIRVTRMFIRPPKRVTPVNPNENSVMV